MVPDCTLVQTNLGPTPRNQPATPSVLYMIFKPVMTDDVSRVAAPCALRVVEGEEVDINRDWSEADFVAVEEVWCWEDGVWNGAGLDGFLVRIGGSLCWVCMRVLTTSRGVVMTPAMPPALAAVAMSRGSPM